MVAVPAFTPVTTPALDTVAIVSSLERHATMRSVTTAPLVSRTVADSATVWPVVTVDVVGFTVTLPTGMGTTLMVALPLLPSLVAVTVATPGATAVTLPLGETIATAVLLDDHTTARSVTTTSFASRTTAESDVTCVGTSATDAGDTVTLPTGTGTTVTDALPLLPPLVAEIVAPPTA
jgi:hypothetical protein